MRDSSKLRTKGRGIGPSHEPFLGVERPWAPKKPEGLVSRDAAGTVPPPIRSTPPSFSVFPQPTQGTGDRVQRLTEEKLLEQDYGQWQSREALDVRLKQNIHPQQNIATFHFTTRPDASDMQDDVKDRGTKTVPSTGVGHYVTVREGLDPTGKAVKDTKKINTSHSEHQVIVENLAKMEDGFPTEKVVDWVYTERPPCPDVWWGNKRIEKGCRTELQQVENLQKQRRWDKDKGGSLPYASRDDLEIQVYYTFESASEIKAAALFAPIRREAWAELKKQLSDIYQEVDEVEMIDIVDSAIPSWEDYSPNKKGCDDYRKAVEKAVADRVEEAGEEVRAAEFFEPIYTEALERLTSALEEIYQKQYAEEDADTMDTEEYDQIPGSAQQDAEDALPLWSDYFISPDDQGKELYAQELEDAIHEAISNAKS